jgi:hypothetical protein
MNHNDALEEMQEVPATKAETASADTSPAKRHKSAWVGPAVGIGSAAIVAALLYTKRRK